MHTLSHELLAFTTSDVTVTEDYVNVSDGVSLKIIDFTPAGDGPEQPMIVFIAGLVSLISGWQNVLKQLTPRYRTIYLETREKKSALLPEDKTVDFSISRMTQDIAEFLQQKVPPERPFCFVGSSLGSTIILDYLSQSSRQSFDAFTIAPNCEFRVPLWFLLSLWLLPPFFYPVTKSTLKWYLRNFRLDKYREPEQVKKYEGTIDEAEPERLKACALAIKDYTLWDKLRNIKAPVLVIAARTDILHEVDEIERMASLMPAARLEIMTSNKETHSEKAGVLIADEIAQHFL
ncbi:MAG: alpha/beta hydrolase [Deltaproteobacteria bacterium]|nr:alpha/beta hydrolase [Deltaproteobacteria bacterium]